MRGKSFNVQAKIITCFSSNNFNRQLGILSQDKSTFAQRMHTTKNTSNRMQGKSRAQKKKGTRFSSSPYILVRLAGIEPTTPWFVAKYSIQLSYSREERYYSTSMARLIGVGSIYIASTGKQSQSNVTPRKQTIVQAINPRGEIFAISPTSAHPIMRQYVFVDLALVSSRHLPP